MAKPKLINPINTSPPSGVGTKAGQLLIQKDEANEIVAVYIVTADGVVKSISSSNIGFAKLLPSVTDVSGSIIDCNNGINTYFKSTVNNSISLSLSNVPTSGVYGFVLKVNHIFGTIQWWNGVKWKEGIQPELNTGKINVFCFVTDDNGSSWIASLLPNYLT